MSKRGCGVDLRVRVVAAYEAVNGTLREVAEDFDGSVNTVNNSALTTCALVAARRDAPHRPRTKRCAGVSVEEESNAPRDRRPVRSGG